ncbi:shikimate dehydrogenase [Lentilactobacillus sp. Marseille-Q4993]|uniref:shikimate dehydrogenase n=1 Tax=Lentilactobacillus sp. Marseille-Q4993 TaxID=3039492 RepID=UPI0024BC98E1|nr:shikimate dehydrogenase [Lentilactobacillus sp. Marseille-Q4993]
MIDGNTKLYGLLAHPAHHSLSPLIHSEAFKQLGINGAYLAFDTETDDLSSVFNSMKQMKIGGFNLSMPYKREALRHMDEVTPDAQKLGAINTVVNRNGKLFGTSTDGVGFIQALADEQVAVAGKRAVVLGAGGAARAIILALIRNNAAQIDVFKRQNATFATTKQELEGWSDLISVHPFGNQNSMKAILGESDILVNATNVGMAGDDHTPIDPALLSPQTVVFDSIYFPLATPLISQAKQNGNLAINGIGMLINQAAESFRLWTGNKMPTAEIKKVVYREIMARKQD